MMGVMLAAAAIAYGCRLAGLILPGRDEPGERERVLLRAVPLSVLSALAALGMLGALSAGDAPGKDITRAAGVMAVGAAAAARWALRRR